MRLVLGYPPNLANPKGISDRVKGYFPSLVTAQHFVESSDLSQYLQAEDIAGTVERVTQPNWQTDIVIVALSGPICAYGEMLLEDCAGTIQGFYTGKYPVLSENPKIGGYYNMSIVRRLGLHENIGFLAKVAAEEMLHVFGVPKWHDAACFFHPHKSFTIASCGYEYCNKCLSFMATLSEPLNFPAVHRMVGTIY